MCKKVDRSVRQWCHAWKASYSIDTYSTQSNVSALGKKIFFFFSLVFCQAHGEISAHIIAGHAS